MNMRSPIVAMLWENWQLTRVEATQRTALGLVAGAAALTIFDAGATYAFWILIACHSFIWFSIAKLNGGRFADGYKPGFPFHLLYARPVPTVVFVGVAMAYDAISCVALYLASAALLGFAFGQPLPLFSMTVCLVAYHLAYTCCQWSTRSRVVQWVGSIGFSWPLFFLVYKKVASSLQVEFSLVENAVFVLMGVVSFWLTVVGVARQRRGDAVAAVPQQKEGLGGYPEWLVSLFRFPCPTSSATRAQVWFDLRSSGLPVVMIGLAVATLIFLLFAISIPFAPARPAAVGVTMFAAPVLLFALGANAFGIRRKQGRTYTSAFELTQPYGTAQMAGLRVLVRTACVLVALIVIGVSVWTSSSLMGAWGEWLPDGNNDALPGLLKTRQTIEDYFGGLTGYAQAALAVVGSIAVASLVTWQAAREALRARYPRRVLVVEFLPAVFALAMVLLTLALRKGFGPVPLVGEIIKWAFWIVGAAMLSATTYLLWRGFVQRVLTIRYACGALVIAAAFAAAWRAGIPAGNVVGILWLALGLLTVIVLAPWALSRVRHI
ncbi:MAG TPA: hypothetical protein VIT67_15435 [Povalibacter sp.]